MQQMLQNCHRLSKAMSVICCLVKQLELKNFEDHGTRRRPEAVDPTRLFLAFSQVPADMSLMNHGEEGNLVRE